MITDAPDGAVITIRAVPRAARTEIAGIRQNALLVRVAAPPVDGAANAALVALLADRLHVPRRAVSVEAGETSRTKRVKVMGVPAAAVRERLGLTS